MKKLPRWIGVIQLPPLAGAPRSQDYPAEALQKAGKRAVQEATYLAQLGFEGIILENSGDAPFYRDFVPPETISSLAIIATAVKEVVPVPIGIRIPNHQGCVALAVAAVTDCDFICVPLFSHFCEGRGVREGKIAQLLREREKLKSDLLFLASIPRKYWVVSSLSEVGFFLKELREKLLIDGFILTHQGEKEFMEKQELIKIAQEAKKQGLPFYLEGRIKDSDSGEVYSKVSGVIAGNVLRKGTREGAVLDTQRSKKWIQICKGSIKRKKASH